MAAKSLLIFTILSTWIAAYGQHAAGPYAMKADSLAEPLSEWTKNNPLSSRCDDRVMEDATRPASGSLIAYCLTIKSKVPETFIYAGAPLLAETAWFHDGTLHKIDIEFLSNEALPSLITSLKQKFGKPFSKQTKRLQNGFGSQFEEKYLTWTNKISKLELIYSNVAGSHVQLRFLLQPPDNAAQSKRAQRSKACADM